MLETLIILLLDVAAASLIAELILRKTNEN